MELLGRLRRAVKKLTFLLNLKKYLTSSTWRIAASMIGTRASATITGPYRWRRRAYSFNDRPGLRACVEIVVDNNDHHHHHHHHHHYHCHASPTQHDDVDYDGGEEDNCGRSECSSGCTSPYTLRRATSYPIQDENIDNKAQMFIDNFHKHLFYEKQVSLDLRYCRDSSSITSSSIDDSTIVSPLSSADSQLVSPI